MGTRHRINVVVNGRLRVCETAGRTSLADLLRDMHTAKSASEASYPVADGI